MSRAHHVAGLALALGVLVSACAGEGAGDGDEGESEDAEFTTVQVTITPPRGSGDGIVSCCVWLADVSTERQRGLMDVTELKEVAGMVFTYDEERTGQFFMYDTPMPLSIAFFDGDGRFVSSADMAPCPDDDPSTCPRYGASGPYRYALEVPQGDLAELGVGPGAVLEVDAGSESARCASS